ncbi:DUF3857 domain-containing protein [Flavobacterium phycosphaerae]|uniref:DUF3857 domain-containing protein n=1 Tax=Flavobacterium phycosphaerae TaxID=2697515 RepID=UPI0013898C51|nr:DUF3857 domain-containing protein [Flavobacterium phycosphaerae]
MRLTVLPFLFTLISLTVFSQTSNYAVAAIPDSLKQNANAVVRLSEMNITISSQNSMILKSNHAITILNELGLNSLDLSEHYDKRRKINKIEATVYNAFGQQIKTYKRKDFKDTSVADGISIFNDNRALYLDYTPIAYPFTMVIETETETSNTAFIPSWLPLEEYLVGVENVALTINFKPELKLKIKEINFSKSLPITKTESVNSIHYSVKNIAAKRREELSPDFQKIFPVVYFGLENFSLENVQGNASSWAEFGKWMYEALLADTEEIPEETVLKIKQLIGNENNPVERAKIVYKYVQEKTRYVSVQVGIGGWKPMDAKEVDKFGYGDCKALTNYTRCLLKSVGVPSYYTVVYAGTNRQDVQNDIASVQGNHVILTLPTANGPMWLECTSQIHPFGFQGDFTDDRTVLVVKPEGGEIVRTKLFSENETIKTLKGSYQLTSEGNFTGKVNMVSKGLEYDNEFGKERMSRENQIKQYKEEFDNINNLTIKKITLNNNPKSIEFTEELELQAEGYAQNSGGKLMFALNAFNQNSNVPKKYKNREFPFEIQRGYTNEDETEITLPEGFMVEAKPNGTELTNEFGYYKIEFAATSDNKIICKRKLIIKKGFYDKTKYEEYRKFRETIAKNDNSKIVIAKA